MHVFVRITEQKKLLFWSKVCTAVPRQPFLQLPHTWACLGLAQKMQFVPSTFSGGGKCTITTSSVALQCRECWKRSKFCNQQAFFWHA